MCLILDADLELVLTRRKGDQDGFVRIERITVLDRVQRCFGHGRADVVDPLAWEFHTLRYARCEIHRHTLPAQFTRNS